MSGSLRETWSTLSRDKPFRYRFLEGAVKYLYRMERRLSETMTAFFVLVVVIICPGFFSLASFTAGQPTKLGNL